MKRILAVLFAMIPGTGAFAVGQTTAFTYQGHLLQNGTPTNGAHNLVFTLWDSATGGGQVGPTISQTGYPVANGVFDIDLDFGAAAFNGQQRWLDVSVDGNELTPRQPVNASPVAVYALSAANGMSVTASTSTNQFTNDHLYTGISLSSQNPTMVMIASPDFNPAGTSKVTGYAKGIDVYSLTSQYQLSVAVGGSGAGTGKPSLGDARVLAKFDPAYAGIAAKLLSGGHFNNLQIDVLSGSNGVATPYVAESFCYGTVFINNMQPMPQTGTFEMNVVAGQVGIRIAQVNSSGVVTGQVQAGWDFVAGSSLSTAPCVD
ncbi:MAG: hypothetical protein JSS28_00545 [Proteobacteria bacterium]|nr:hypothetical protein [Pseudomonadota bacterium]